VCPGEGLIFGRHDYRLQLPKAAKQVLPPHVAATFTAYDLRHRCATELAATGDLTGAAYLMSAHLRLQPAPCRAESISEFGVNFGRG
jgi:hypothetical protein